MWKNRDGENRKDFLDKCKKQKMKLHSLTSFILWSSSTNVKMWKVEIEKKKKDFLDKCKK